MPLVTTYDCLRRTRSCGQVDGPAAVAMSAMLAAQLAGSAPRLSGDSGAHAACKYDASSPVHAFAPL